MQRWYQKSGVQAALAGGLFVLLAALVQSLATWYTAVSSKGPSSVTDVALDQGISVCENMHFGIDARSLTQRLPVGSNLKIQTVVLRRIELVGSTVYPRDYLDSITKEWTGRSVSIEDLVKLRDLITVLYVNAGYINSGAVIPHQDVVGGLLKVNIIEGTVSKIIPYVDSGVDLEWITKTVRLSLSNPFNCKDIDKALNRVTDRYPNTLICFYLGPSSVIGQAILRVYVGGLLNPCKEPSG